MNDKEKAWKQVALATRERFGIITELLAEACNSLESPCEYRAKQLIERCEKAVNESHVPIPGCIMRDLVIEEARDK